MTISRILFIFIVFLVVGLGGASTDYPTNESSNDIPVLPDIQTTLKPMDEMVTNNSILYPVDASSYIIPENEVVKWYAENTVLTDDALLWKHNGSAVEFKYQSDNKTFNFPLNSEMWQNPDYYLTHKLIGDCDDFSFAFASILEAKGIHAEAIGVKLINNRNHWIVEYPFNNQINYASINKESVIIYHNSYPYVKKIYVNISTQEYYNAI